MDSTKSAKELVTKIWNAENNDGLLGLSVRGLNLYQHIRIKLYYEIAKQINLFNPSHYLQKSSRINKLLSYIQHAVVQNEFWGIQKSKLLVVESARQDQVEKKNIYTHLLLKNIRHEYSTIRYPNPDKPGVINRQKSEAKIYYDYFLLKSKFLTNHTINRKDYQEFAKISQRVTNSVKNHVNLSFDVYTYVLKNIINAYFAIKGAINLLARVDPVLLIVEDAYTHSEIVHAAKMTRIPVIELQHSIIYPYHLGYGYPGVMKGSVDIFPDYLFTFGEFWNSVAAYPVDEEKIIATGFPHFDLKRKTSRHFQRDDRQILFISQNTIGKELFKIAVNTATKLRDYVVIFKLHPKEYVNWRERYGEDLAHIPANLYIYGDESPGIYVLFSRCGWQIGVFSTALYEGIGCGVKTIICGLPGWEFVDNLIKGKFAYLAKDSDEIVGLIGCENLEIPNVELIFKSNALQNMCDGVDMVLRNEGCWLD